MRLRKLALLFCLALPVCATASETPTEHAANVAAAEEMAAAPVHGNLPDYSLPPDELAKAQHLSAVHVNWHFAKVVWSIVQLALLLWLGVIAWMRDAAVRTSRNRWGQGFIFLLLFVIAGFILNLPLDLYKQHLFLQYGLSVQSWASWFGDQAKTLLLTWILGGLLVMLLFRIIRKFPRNWWLVFWAISIPIVLIGIFATPYVIDPLFNKFEPLQATNPALVERLEKVVARGNMNIPPERMFLMKASAKVTTMNAYVTGFGASKRVVVWDTSLQKGTPDEVLFIFGHESGHYVLNHIVTGILFAELTLLVLFYLAYLFMQWTIQRFGARWRIPSQQDWGALAVLALAFSIFSAVLEPVQNTFSRSQEHAADVYGQEAIHGIVADPQKAAQGAFQVLGETSFDEPNEPPFVEFWTDTHPAIGRRAAFAAHYDPWASGAEPKYFKK
ncbi:MAG: M48 family metallopeptidase [Acidobacteriaceae bacterium]